jgi:hypothetical protein
VSRLRANNQAGMTGALLDAGSGTEVITGLFAVAPSFATLVSPDYYVLVLEPNTANYEIVWLTVYTAGSPNGSILRGQEGTSPVTHAAGVSWEHGPTAQDFAAPTPTVVNGTYTVPPTSQVFARKLLIGAAGQVVIPADSEFIFL